MILTAFFRQWLSRAQGPISSAFIWFISKWLQRFPVEIAVDKP
jgi:hypothetical protein